MSIIFTVKIRVTGPLWAELISHIKGEVFLVVT